MERPWFRKPVGFITRAGSSPAPTARKFWVLKAPINLRSVGSVWRESAPRIPTERRECLRATLRVLHPPHENLSVDIGCEYRMLTKVEQTLTAL